MDLLELVREVAHTGMENDKAIVTLCEKIVEHMVDIQTQVLQIQKPHPMENYPTERMQVLEKQVVELSKKVDVLETQMKEINP